MSTESHVFSVMLASFDYAGLGSIYFGGLDPDGLDRERGVGRIGLREVPFDGIQSYACADFGRGVWPIRSAWNWGAASGTREERRIGLNLGGQWTDGTGRIEKPIYVDGRLSKASEDLVWTYDRADFMKPWYLHTRGSGRINLAFMPVLERAARQRAGERSGDSRRSELERPRVPAR